MINSKNRIFLCHAREDHAEALKMYKKLKVEGFDPWLDKKDLLPGQNWRIETPKALKSARFVIIFFSKTSVSHKGFVQKEFKLALDTLQEMPDGELFIIPVRLDNCKVPDSFADIHYCDLFEEDGLDLAFKTIRSVLGEAELPKSVNKSNPSKAENIGLSLEDHREFKQLKEKLEEQQEALEALPQEASKSVPDSAKVPEGVSSDEVVKLRKELKQKQLELERLKEAKSRENQSPPLTPSKKLVKVFRSKPENKLSVDAVKQMLKQHGFYDSDFNPVRKRFVNAYEEKGDIVIDKASGLMWQQSGYAKYLSYSKAEKYVADMNESKFSGYSDWRLPTLEEAMSLMESKRKNGDLYIDSVFDSTQRWIWTADRDSTAGKAWTVSFRYGYCPYGRVASFSLHVRAVRSDLPRV
ncbi:MAG: TIR domain-containing protein [Calditrichia bacterium]